MATINPYQDRAEAQMMAANQPTQPVQQQPYNLFAQQKQSGYPNANTPKTGPRVAGEAGIVHSTPIIEPTVSTDEKPAPVSKPFVSSGGVQRKTAPITNTDELARAMGYTSPEEEERRRKASLANMRIMAVADAVRQIGNIANTINYAPSQQFTTPVMDEYNRYEKGKALRDAANYKYLSYQQQKAAQDAKQKQWEQQFNLNIADNARKDALNDARISRYNAQNEKDGANKAYWETRARLLEDGWPLDKAIKEAKKAQIEESARLTRIKANQGGFAPRRTGGGGNGGQYWDYDEEGKIHYYPNKTMWEQGVESHTRDQKQQEEYKTIDGYGDQKVTYKKRPIVSKAGENAHNAAQKKAPAKKKALPGQTSNSQQKTKKKLP